MHNWGRETERNLSSLFPLRTSKSQNPSTMSPFAGGGNGCWQTGSCKKSLVVIWLVSKRVSDVFYCCSVQDLTHNPKVRLGKIWTLLKSSTVYLSTAVCSRDRWRVPLCRGIFATCVEHLLMNLNGGIITFTSYGWVLTRNRLHLY